MASKEKTKDPLGLGWPVCSLCRTPEVCTCPDWVREMSIAEQKKLVLSQGLFMDSEGSIYFHGEDGSDHGGVPFMWSFSDHSTGKDWFRWNKTLKDKKINAEDLREAVVLIAHNMKHDYKAAKAMGVDIDFERVLCSMVMFKTMFPTCQSAALKKEDVSQYVGVDADEASALEEWFEAQRQPHKLTLLGLFSAFRKATGHKWPYTNNFDKKDMDIEAFMADPRWDDAPHLKSHVDKALREYHAQRDYTKVPPEIIEPYASEDAKRGSILVKKLVNECPDDVWPVMINESKVSVVLAEMEYKGIRIDQDWCWDVVPKLRDRVDGLRTKIFDLAGYEFDIDSHPQVASLLYEKIGYTPPRNTAKDKPATDGYCLAMIGTPITDAIGDYRVSSKALDYIENQFYNNSVVDEVGDYIVHPSFNQVTAVTRRLSCREPNLQNVMRNETTAKYGLPNVRRGFIPRDGWDIYAGDFKQMEMVGLAFYSEEPKLVCDINEKKDLHDELAFDLFGVTRPAKDAAKAVVQAFKINRLIAKTEQFGTIYGMGVSGFIRSFTEQLFSILPNADKSMIPDYEDGKQMLDEYFERRPKVRKFRETVGQVMVTRGYVKDIFGQRYFLRDPSKSYVAINYLIQGMCAQWVKHTMVKIWREIVAQEAYNEIMPLVQVHDELIFEIRQSRGDVIAKKWIRKVKEIMESFNPMLKFKKPVGGYDGVKMTVEIAKFMPTETGGRPNWGGKKDIDLNEWMEAA